MPAIRYLDPLPPEAPPQPPAADFAAAVRVLAWLLDRTRRREPDRRSVIYRHLETLNEVIVAAPEE